MLDVQNAVGGAVKLAQLSDQDNELGGGVNPAVVTQAIEEATAEIASYVGHRISATAIAESVPPVLRLKAANWTARVLRRNAYNGQPLEDDLTREETDRKWLDGIARGVYSLGVEPELPPADIVNDKAAYRDPTLIVSRARLRGFS